MAAAQSLFFTLIGGVAAYHGQIRNIRSHPNASPKCLDIENSHYHYTPSTILAGTAVQLWDCNGKWNQDWKFSLAGKTGQLISTKTKNRMCLSYAKPNDLEKVKLELCSKAPASNWKYDPVNKMVKVQSDPTLCLGICVGMKCGCADGTLHCNKEYPHDYALAHLTKCAVAPHATTHPLLWDLPGPAEEIYNAGTTMCLDIENYHYRYSPDTIQPDTKVQLWHCNGKWNQKWRPVSTSSPGSFQIASSETLKFKPHDMCLDVPLASIGDFSVKLEECKATTATQLWKFIPGVHHIESISHPGRCLTIGVGYPHERAPAELYKCSTGLIGNPNHVWHWWFQTPR